MFAYLLLFTALFISTISGYISILGLTSIFSAESAFIVISLIAISLEVGKLVSVAYLDIYWKKLSIIIRFGFLVVIMTLMLLNMISIFGYLSRAHIDQQVKINSGAATNITILDQQIKIKEDEIADIDKQIAVIDDSITKMIEKGQAKSSLTANTAQKTNRKTLVEQKTTILNELSPLKVEKIKLESEVQKLEAEVGPIKYVAEVIYGESSTEILDKSIRAVIILLILVFDPLAVLLLLAFNITVQKKDDYADIEFMEYKPRQRRSRANTAASVLPIT